MKSMQSILELNSDSRAAISLLPLGLTDHNSAFDPYCSASEKGQGAEDLTTHLISSLREIKINK